MEVIANNCVSTISVPKDAKSGDRVAYNPILNLYVTMNYGYGISAWSPVSGKVTHITDLGPDGCLDMVMCPNNHIAISYAEAHHGRSVQIYSLEKIWDENSAEPKAVNDIESDLQPDYPGMIADGIHEQEEVIDMDSDSLPDSPESIEQDEVLDMDSDSLPDSSDSIEHEAVLEIGSDLLSFSQKFIIIALSPDGILVTDYFTDYRHLELYDFTIDWDRLKCKNSRSFQNRNANDYDPLAGELKELTGLYCTPQYELLRSLSNNSLMVGRIVDPIITKENSGHEQWQVVRKDESKCKKDNDDSDNDDVDNNSNGSDDDSITKDIKEFEDEVIDHCIVDGIEFKLDCIKDFIHDGENLIIQNADKILLLETCTNGSTAYLIASDLNPASNGLGINHKGQLMLCDGEDSIKIYEYKGKPRSLQDLCRCFILEAIPCNYRENVEKLSLPKTLTTFLLFKDLGY